MARWGISRTSAGLALAFTLLAAAAPGARGDGDPASDYLIGNQVFLTSQTATVSPAERELRAVVAAANRAGFPIRAAVISNQYDLGSITALWEKPDTYARFLGLELSSAYRQRLLVVMPDGFGFNWPGHPAAPAYRLLRGVPRGAGSDGLAVAAQTAVRRLAGASGVRLASSPQAPAPPSPRSSGSDLAVILGATLGALAAIGAIAFVIVRVRRRRKRRPPAQGGAPGWRALPAGLRWAIPAVTVLFAAVVTLSVLALRRTSPAVSAAAVVTAPPFNWPAGARPAPDLNLRDQAGRAVSVADYRGRPVIVTFIDPLCRNLCPLEAQVLNQTVRRMPASRRPVILAVSVDVYANANARADLLRDVHEWHLVPEWRWAVGRPAQLAAAWKRYEIGVSVVTKRIGKTAIHYITHTEAAYIVDRSGHERALFVWPFYPQDVVRELQRLT